MVLLEITDAHLCSDALVESQSAACDSSARSRAAMTTRAPLAPNSRAMARPRPLEPPEISTTFPACWYYMCLVAFADWTPPTDAGVRFTAVRAGCLLFCLLRVVFADRLA